MGSSAGMIHSAHETDAGRVGHGGGVDGGRWLGTAWARAVGLSDGGRRGKRRRCGAAPGATVKLEPGHGAHAMVERVAAAGGPDPACTNYGPSGADVTLRVTPPGMSQTFTVPISVGRNEGLCNLQIPPLTGD
jgi:Protein of unknown function (DUF4232)